jgi:hypothetical protein
MGCLHLSSYSEPAVFYLDSDDVLTVSTAFLCLDMTLLLVCFLITSILIPRPLVFTQEVVI